MKNNFQFSAFSDGLIHRSIAKTKHALKMQQNTCTTTLLNLCIMPVFTTLTKKYFGC